MSTNETLRAINESFPRPEDMDSLVSNYSFVNNDAEAMNDLLNSIYLDKISKRCFTIMYTKIIYGTLKRCYIADNKSCLMW